MPSWHPPDSGSGSVQNDESIIKVHNDAKTRFSWIWQFGIWTTTPFTGKANHPIVYNPGSLDCESGILSLSYRAPLCLYGYEIYSRRYAVTRPKYLCNSAKSVITLCNREMSVASQIRPSSCWTNETKSIRSTS